MKDHDPSGYQVELLNNFYIHRNEPSRSTVTPTGVTETGVITFRLPLNALI